MIFDVIGLAQINGVFQALGYSLCLVLVMLDYKKGTIISYILFSFSVINILKSIVLFKAYNSISGLVNIFISVFTIGILTWQFAKRERLIITDSVTNLTNRRGLFKVLGNKTKNDRPFNIAVVSIDNFKILNDNHGREYGDKLLLYVAETSKKNSEK